MQPVPGLPHDIHSVMMTQTWAIMRGIITIRVGRPIQWARSSPILGVCTICMAMCGNGCRMSGIVTMMVHQLMAVPDTVSGEAAAGSALQDSAGQPNATHATA